MKVFWFFLDVSVNILENAVICFFIHKHFPGKFSKNKNFLVNIMAVMVISGVYTLYLFFPPPWFVDFFGLSLYWLLFALLFLKGFPYEKSFWGVFLVSINSICAVFVITCGTYITGVSQDTAILSQDIFRIILIVSAKTLQFALFYYFSKFLVISQTTQKRIFIALLSFPLLCLFIMTTLMNIGQSVGTDTTLLKYLASSSLCVIIFLMITYYLYNRLSRQGKRLLKLQSELQFQKLMEQRNAELIKIDADMRSWRHDINNHIQSMMVLARTGNNAELENFAANLDRQLKEAESVCNTGNRAFDAIVSVKYALAKAEGIAVNLQMTPIAPVPVNDIDLTSLIGNMFDNAIEACRKADTKKRSIDLFWGMMESMVCIRMSNSSDGIDRIKNGKFLTTKTEERLHGMGLASIDRIVDAAGGMVNRTHKDNVFTTVVLFPKKQ